MIAAAGVASLSAASEQTLVLNDPTGAPYTNASRTGFLDIIVTEAIKKVGLGIELIRLPAERGLLNANAGIDDGGLSRIAGLEKIYPNLIPVPEILITMSFGSFTRDPRMRISDWQSLGSHSVGYIRGLKLLENNVPVGTAVTPANDLEQLFTMLGKGRVRVVLYEMAMGLELARKRRMDDVRFLKPALATTPLFMYLHKNIAI